MSTVRGRGAQAYTVRPQAGEALATSSRRCRCRSVGRRPMAGGDGPGSEDERDPEKEASEGEGSEPLKLPLTELRGTRELRGAWEPRPSREQSRQTPHCRHLPRQESAEGVIFFPHKMRPRRGYWAKYIVPIIHINGNSMVATCHLLD